jgi:hypothetical protein
MFTDQRETMALGDQESLLEPMKQTWTMCFRGDQSEFGPIGDGGRYYQPCMELGRNDRVDGLTY